MKCQSRTKRGTPCKNLALLGGDFCAMHSKTISKLENMAYRAAAKRSPKSILRMRPVFRETIKGYIKEYGKRLVQAVNNGDRESVKLLLEAGADPNVENDDGFPIIASILTNFETDMLNLMIRYGVDLNVSIDGDTLLVYTIQEFDEVGDDEIQKIKILIDAGADVNKLNYGLSPLKMAIMINNINLAKLLIENGADIKIGVPIVSAVINGNIDMIDLLIEYGANVNEKDNLGNTALITAAAYGYKDISMFLIKSGANVNDINNDGNSAIAEAKVRGFKTIVRLLKENGAVDMDYRGVVPRHRLKPFGK